MCKYRVYILAPSHSAAERKTTTKKLNVCRRPGSTLPFNILSDENSFMKLLMEVVAFDVPRTRRRKERTTINTA